MGGVESRLIDVGGGSPQKGPLMEHDEKHPQPKLVIGFV